ncbi:uncharacterized protein LOC143912951 [Arctopsyche grandis]|uniref:uncharacterized protein LOC143912951 n=1 Tax=Arctopsyche grandis TaxID=121162 RepID=UPI00406D8E98
MITDIKMMSETALGELMVWDCSNTKLGHVVKMTPMFTKKILFLIQKCFSAKIKEDRIADRIFVHKSLEDFHKHISPKYLPKELGGFNMSMSEVSNRLKSDEAKRPISSENPIDDLLGITGSFRKLD